MPVVSIGNLTWGGTGKTPLLVKLTADLKKAGLQSAVLTRGYRGVGEGSPSQNSVNDEVQLMHEKNPDGLIAVGADRVKKAEELLKTNPLDIFLLDDGFQHWKLERDLDVVCIDATDPWGGNALIPLGRLREPKKNLKRAQVIVLTRCELVSPVFRESLKKETKILAPRGIILCSEFKSVLVDWDGRPQNPTSLLYGQIVLALSAIGNPQAFEERISRWGASVRPRRFRDHHEYSDLELQKLKNDLEKEKAILVTTEKDGVKLRKSSWAEEHLRPQNIYFIKIELSFGDNDESQWKKILKKFVK